jgi:hypothetical protein
MINFNIGHYLAALQLVNQEIGTAQHRINQAGPNALLLDGGRDRIRQNFQYVLKTADDLDLPIVRSRVERIFDLLRLNPQVFCAEIINEMTVLLEAFEDDVKFLYLYAYPREKAKRYLTWRGDWSPALAAFPSISNDVDSASDLYALGHNTACVFHCMRVLEHGLKGLAADVGENYDTQLWGQIIGAIEARITLIRNNGLPGLAKADKDARLQFLSAAAKDFAYFKDGWRNYVAHNKSSYGGDEAAAVLEHVKSFMNHLASRLAEAGRGSN